MSALAPKKAAEKAESKKRKTKKKGKLPGSGDETAAGKSGEGPGRDEKKSEENER